jgi:Zn-dependent protease with chaperone function
VTFVFRGLVVGLGFFGVLYCLSSLLIVFVWHTVNLVVRRSPVRSARLLFGLRILPLVGSAFITLVFALPAFFLLEGAMDEDIGTLLFSVGTLLLVAAASIRVARAQSGASRLVAQWLEGAQPLGANKVVPMLQVKQGLPPLLLQGISKPRVLVSETAVAMLSPDEMRVAVQHEMGHIRSRDNLKKLILHAAQFPGMASLERAWQEAAEFAADEAAVANSDDAVDLASALITLGDLIPVQDSPAFTTGLMDMAALVNLRVRRLLMWNGTSSSSLALRWWHFLPAIVITVLYIFANYGHALLFTHWATEWFIG